MKKTLIRPPKIYYTDNKEPYIIYNNKKYSLKGYSNKEIIDILNKLKNKNVNIEDVDKNKIIKLINDQIRQYLKEKKTQPRRGYIPSRRIRQNNEKLNNTKSQIKELIELLKLQIITKKDVNEEKKKEEEIKKYINNKMKDISNNYKAIEDKDAIEKKKKIKEEEEYYNKIINERNEEIKKLDDNKEELIKVITQLHEDKNINKKELDNYRSIKNNLDNQILTMSKTNKELLKENINIKNTSKNLLDTIKKLDQDNKNIINAINNKKNELDKINDIILLKENKLNKLVNNYNNIYKENDRINFINNNQNKKFDEIEKIYIDKGYLKKDELLDKYGPAQSGTAIYNTTKKELLNYIYDKIPKEDININDIIKEEQQGEGKKDNDEGLTDTDINKIMEPYKIYIKTISKDELDEMIKYIIDHNIYKCCFIMNTLERNQYKEVGHWQAFYICLDDPYYSIEFFDSYGSKPDYRIINKFKYMINKMEIPTFIKFKYNKIKQQYNDTSTCGLHSILFLIKRIYNISFKDATNYNKTIKETEEDVNKLKEFYEHFKLI